MPNINFFNFSENYLTLKKKPELLYVGKLTDEQKWKSKSYHLHESACEVMIVVQGSGFVRIHQTHYSFQRGDVIVYNGNVLHMEDLSETLEPPVMYYAVIKNIFIDGMKKDCMIPDGITPVLSGKNNIPTLKYLFEMLFKEGENREPGYAAVCNGLLQSLLINVIRLINNQYQLAIHKNDHSLKIKIRDYLETHFAERITLKEMSQHFFISEYYLIHLFKSFFGESPIEYLIRYRMERSTELLKNTDLSIREIALMSGYDNASYFSIVFKKSMSCTPTQYRKKASNSQE